MFLELLGHLLIISFFLGLPLVLITLLINMKGR